MRIGLTWRHGAVLVAFAAAVAAGPVAALAAGANTASITPSAGPPGTIVTVSATVPVRSRAQYLTRGDHAVLYLQRRYNGGDFQLVAAGHATAIAGGQLAAIFRIPNTGDYDAGKPDNLSHPAIPGSYNVSFPCHACDLAATFTVTTDGGVLASTGLPIASLATLGVLLVMVGGGATRIGRQRRPRGT